MSITICALIPVLFIFIFFLNFNNKKKILFNFVLKTNFVCLNSFVSQLFFFYLMICSIEFFFLLLIIYLLNSRKSMIFGILRKTFGFSGTQEILLEFLRAQKIFDCLKTLFSNPRESSIPFVFVFNIEFLLVI